MPNTPKRPLSVTGLQPGAHVGVEPQPTVDRRVGWLFVMLFLLYMFDYIDREIVSSLIPLMKADLGISDTQAGSLVSAVYWSIVVLAFPVSILVDRWSRRRSVGIMVMLWSIATGLAAFIRTFPQLFMTRLGVGVGESGYAPGGTAMISAMYPREKRSRMNGIWNASIPLGSAIGVGLGGVIATAWGWKHAFGLVAAPGVPDRRAVLLLRAGLQDGEARATRYRDHRGPQDAARRDRPGVPADSVPDPDLRGVRREHVLEHRLPHLAALVLQPDPGHGQRTRRSQGSLHHAVRHHGGARWAGSSRTRG